MTELCPDSFHFSKQFVFRNGIDTLSFDFELYISVSFV